MVFYESLELLGFGWLLNTHDLAFAVGQVLAGVWAFWRLGRVGVPAWLRLLVPFFAVPSIIYGAHLFAWLTMDRPQGYVLYGGLFAALAAGALAWRIFYRPWLPGRQWFDDGMVGLFFIFGMSRVGCHLMGCCHGTPAPMGWPSVTYPSAELVGPQIGWARDVPLHPAAAYEALGMLLLLVGAAALRGRLRPGRQGWALLSGYAALRFLLEFIRGDSRGGTVYGLYPSQVMSLAVLALAALVLWTERSAEAPA